MMLYKAIIACCLSLILNVSILTAQEAYDPVEAEIEAILAQLTLEEKVALCHAQSKFSTRGVPRLGIPEVWMADGPHGVRGEINWDNWGYADWTNDSSTAFPALTCLASTFNPSLSYRYGKALGEEARYRKKDVILGPGVNIYRTPLNGRNFEYMGEDPMLASTLVVPYIKGVQENGVAACLKHFVLNNQERWRNHINVKVSDRALYEIYLPAFKVAVEDADVWSIMGAYNQYKGQQLCHNDYLLNGVLKGDWAFDGVVISDWGGAHDTRQAALYGLDMEMGTGTNGLTTSIRNAYNDYYLAHPFLELLQSGEIPESVVDDKARRILRLMFRTNMSPDRPRGRMNNQEHLDLAREIGQQGIVLLKNEDDFFPLNADEQITIAVIGENANKRMTIGGGSSELKARNEISPLKGIQERFSNATIVHTMGYASGPPAYGRVVPSDLDADSLRKEALSIASNADVVLFVGGLNKNYEQDSEGGDRVQYALPFGQPELISALKSVNPNLGVVLVSGNAVEMSWINDVRGIMQAWFLGSETGHALADVISGDVNPTGKLPFTFPVKLEDNGAHHFGEISYPGDSINQEYLEDILVGYRWHDTKEIQPAFAFGHGLSYTSFEISDVTLNKERFVAGDQLNLFCRVSNTGEREGAEVVQVYIGKPESEVVRAVKELRGFQRVEVKTGETQIASITIDIDDLAYYDESMGDWNLEKGEYLIYVGNASDHISETMKIVVE